MAERLLAKGEKGQHQCDKCFKLFDFVGNGQWIPTTCPDCSNKKMQAERLSQNWLSYLNELEESGRGGTRAAERAEQMAQYWLDRLNELDGLA